MPKSLLKDLVKTSEEEVEGQEENPEEVNLLEALSDEDKVDGKSSFSIKQTLLDAVKTGKKPILELLLQGKQELLNEPLSNGLTPLAVAIANRQTEIVEFLLEKGCSLKTGHELYPDAEALANFWGKSELAKLIGSKKRKYLEKNAEDTLIPAFENRTPNKFLPGYENQFERGAYTQLQSTLFQSSLALENHDDTGHLAFTEVKETVVQKKARISTCLNNASAIKKLPEEKDSSPGPSYLAQGIKMKESFFNGPVQIYQQAYPSAFEPAASTEQINLLKSTLVNAYKNNLEIKSLFGKALKLESQYINLQMLYFLELKEDKNESSHQEQAPTRYKESRVPSFEDLFGDKRSIKPKDLFKPDKDLFHVGQLKYAKKAKVIPYFFLIQGRAGIGKTTFVRYITREWACGKLYPEYEWVFTLVLRELRNTEFKKILKKGENLKLWEWIYRSQFASQSLTETEFKILWQQQIEPLINQRKILLVLDGYDELPENHPCQKTLNSLLRGEYAHIPKIMTTRPYGIHELPQERRDLEIIGFTDENIEHYIKQYFEFKSELGFQLLSFLEKNPTLWATCHIPLHLNLICWMVEKEIHTQSLSVELNQLNTMTDLYTTIETNLLERCYLERQSSNVKLPPFKETRTQFLLKEYAIERQFLSELAFKERQNESVIISSSLIESLLNGKISLEHQQSFMKRLTDLGLIKPIIKEGIPEYEQSYEFFTFNLPGILCSSLYSRFITKREIESNHKGAYSCFQVQPSLANCLVVCGRVVEI